MEKHERSEMSDAACILHMYIDVAEVNPRCLWDQNAIDLQLLHLYTTGPSQFMCKKATPLMLSERFWHSAPQKIDKMPSWNR